MKLDSKSYIDPHLVAGFLKQFIRDLPQSLLVGTLADCWMQAIRMFDLFINISSILYEF